MEHRSIPRSTYSIRAYVDKRSTHTHTSPPLLPQSTSPPQCSCPFSSLVAFPNNIREERCINKRIKMSKYRMGQALLYLRIDIFQRVFGKRGWGRRRPCSTCTLYARSWQLSVRKNNNREKWNLVCRTEFAPFLFFLFRSGCFFFFSFFI